MTITAPGPRRIDHGAVSIRVRGDCNHEWTARTTKAAAIQQGRGEPGRSRIRLYCAECYRLGGPRHNLTYVVAVETTRKCACGNRLSVYNPGPCFACQRREAARLASAIVTIEDRILDHLSQNNRTAPWLASVMRLSEPTVRGILNELVRCKQIELAARVQLSDGSHRCTYKLREGAAE
jgi:hypothetical protein